MCTCCIGMKCVCTETLASARDSHCSPDGSSRSDSFAAPGLEMLPDTPWRMAPESVSSKACQPWPCHIRTTWHPQKWQVALTMGLHPGVVKNLYFSRVPPLPRQQARRGRVPQCPQWNSAAPRKVQGDGDNSPFIIAHRGKQKQTHENRKHTMGQKVRGKACRMCPTL